jgi:hypothetical protein
VPPVNSVGGKRAGAQLSGGEQPAVGHPGGEWIYALTESDVRRA